MTHTPIYQVFVAGHPGHAYLHRADAVKAAQQHGHSTQYTMTGTRWDSNAEVRELVQVAFPLDFGAFGDMDVVVRYTAKHNALGLPVVQISEAHIAGIGNVFRPSQLATSAKIELRRAIANAIEADLLAKLEAAA
jgi:hypothetical protein